MIGERIKKARLNLGWSQDELAKRIGYESRGAIYKIESGRNDVKQSKIPLFASVLGVSISYLLGTDENEPSKTETGIKNILPVPQTKKIPMIGGISCGTPTFAEQEFTYVDGPIRADFCLTAKGDSMIGARILDGDLVFCKAQEEVDDGEIAAVIIDDAATLKRFYHYPDRNMVILRSENPDYKDQIYIGEELSQMRVLGKAIAFQSSIH